MRIEFFFVKCIFLIEMLSQYGLKLKYQYIHFIKIIIACT